MSCRCIFIYGIYSGREKAKSHESIWGVGVYLAPWLVVIIPHPLVVFSVVSRVAYKFASYPECLRKEVDHDGPVSGTEPPSESETTNCQAYQVQLLRDRYRLLVDAPCNTKTIEGIYVGDFDSADRVSDGVEVFASLPTVSTCRDHQLLYRSHVKNHTCSEADCADRGFANPNKDDRQITECVCII